MFGAAPTARDAAVALTPFTKDAGHEEVAAFLQAALGARGGAGLLALAEVNESAGAVFGAAFALNNLCRGVVVNAANCAKLAALGRDVLAILDAAGRKGTAVDGAMLSALACCVDDCCSLVEGFSQPGWLLRVACNEQLREEFITLHDAVLEILSSDGLGALPGGRELPMGDYSNVTKAARRTLKQIGRGSVTAGVAASRDPESVAAREVAALLEVTPEQIASEARRVPESDLDIDTLFHSLLGGTGFASALAAPEREAARGAGDVDKADYSEMFSWYDADKSGAIELPELQLVLADLGLLEGKTAREAAACAENHMRAADGSGAGALSLEAFSRWCSTLVTNKARQHLRLKMGLQTEEDLRAAFTAFASFGAREVVRDMDGKALIKMARDTGVLGGGLTPTDVDLIFAKVKSKGARRITFDQFLAAVSSFAEKKRVSFEDLVRQMLAAGGPVAHATKAEAVRLHDDRSTYTGVYKHGGPTAVDDVFDLATFVDRDRASAGGATPGSAAKDRGAAGAAIGRSPGVLGGRVVATPSSARRMSTGPVTPRPSTASCSRRASTVDDAGSCGGNGAGVLQEVFNSFAKFGIRDDRSEARTPGSAPPKRFETYAATPGSVGKGPATPGAVQMDGFRFAKLCREAGLVDGKKLTTTSVDLIFTKAKAKGAKKIGYDEFCRALQMVADTKACDLPSVAYAVENCGGPAVGTATTPDSVRFYDAARRASGIGAGGDRQNS